MKQKIEAAANVLFIVGILVLGALFVKDRWFPSQEPPTVAVGDTLPTIRGYDWKAHDKTLVLALRNGCHYCEDSMAFYRKLDEMEKDHHMKTHLLAVFPDNPKIVTAVLGAQQLHVDYIAPVPLSSLKVTGTPTLIAVNSEGQVTASWVGQLPGAGEDSVIKLVSTGRN